VETLDWHLLQKRSVISSCQINHRLSGALRNEIKDLPFLHSMPPHSKKHLLALAGKLFPIKESAIVNIEITPMNNTLTCAY
jgi:hypothetical protein